MSIEGQWLSVQEAGSVALLSGKARWTRLRSLARVLLFPDQLYTLGQVTLPLCAPSTSPKA